MATLRFKRKLEDFKCENCGYSVRGSGYTNHCPNCLWSKHVDAYPGDREAYCGGLMEPITAQLNAGSYDLFHRCTKCRVIKRNRSAKDDNIEVIIQLSAQPRPVQS